MEKISLIPISERLYLIPAPERGRFPFCYSILLDDQVKVLFDSGFKAATAVELKKKGIDIVVNTHFHLDHTLKNRDLGDVQVWCHGLDAPGIRSAEVHMAMYGFYAHGASEMAQKFINGFGIQGGPVHRELRDGEVLDFGRTCWRVIHAPGHTPGHCVLFEEESGLLISGDIDLSSFGPWYLHHCSDQDDFIRSIDKCIALRPRTVISGHRGALNKNLPGRFINYRDSINRKAEEILRHISSPRSLNYLAGLGLFYGERAGQDSYFKLYEKLGVLKHLERLTRQGLVKREGDIFFRA